MHPIIQSEYGSNGRKRKNVITFKHDYPTNLTHSSANSKSFFPTVTINRFETTTSVSIEKAEFEMKNELIRNKMFKVGKLTVTVRSNEPSEEAVEDFNS
ncbi:hypothetical protein [Peribacillus sp. ACCC06369]|nr:hypothetical protein [Peribacillus sp. ACCC06369]